ncbi:PrpF domain-containing protein [Bacillus sp. FJAT-50079]|uniref:2-methylaconitate cis-trans isomerase PrpF family protein n=1 Tax=Bacillus sp. FJAT-50079 TaxID=2833577 RepID=UPI001BCA394E|nr:PrpF domain-containing protein [Bacillus sp. FJAT-50079]MBS4208171.1 PrpF protein [Bacillus sp. FJAT-50079]
MNRYLQQCRIPTTIMRGGTSKGLILRSIDLPIDPKLRDQIILRIYGSPDSSQIDGLGGGTSLTSKLGLVSPPSRPGAHIDYTFGQVSIDRNMVDYQATCGNMATAVGLYALEEGYLSPFDPVTNVQVYNTNTRKMIIVEIPVKNGQIQYDGDFKIDGVPGFSPKIMLNFLDSGGTYTGKTLPTSRPIDIIHLPDGQHFEVSIIDSVNPLVFVRAEDVGVQGIELPDEINNNELLLNTLEAIRVKAGILSGIITNYEAVTPTSHALPKIALVAKPQDYVNINNKKILAESIDITSRYISMGNLHRAFAVSGAIALATAAQISGTIPNQLAVSSIRGIRIGHPSGVIYTEATVTKSDENWNVSRAAIGRTARRIMDGFAYVPISLINAQKIEKPVLLDSISSI